jgi:hypothetical protein
MAVKNRVEVTSAVNSAIVPTVTNSIHRTLLNDSVVNSVVFRKDVIASQTPAAGAVTINYSDKDTATVATAVTLAVSFSDIENGDVKYLVITKAAGNQINFVGAVEYVPDKYYITLNVTALAYRVSNKNGTIYVEALFQRTSTESSTMFSEEMEIGAWDMDYYAVKNVYWTLPAGHHIVAISVMIYYNSNISQVVPLDFATIITPGLNTPSGAYQYTDKFKLERFINGMFDQPAFNDPTQNRGTILVTYKVN